MVKRKRRKIPVRKPLKKGRTEYFKIFLLFLFIIIISCGIYYIYTYQGKEEIQENIGESVVNKKIIQIEILNGCGVPGLARQTEYFLRSKGFDVVKTDNASSFDYPETVVIARDTTLVYAKKVAEVINAEDNVIQQINKGLLLDVSIIIGKDYKKLTFFEQKKEGLP